MGGGTVWVTGLQEGGAFPEVHIWPMTSHLFGALEDAELKGGCPHHQIHSTDPDCTLGTPAQGGDICSWGPRSCLGVTTPVAPRNVAGSLCLGSDCSPGWAWVEVVDLAMVLSGLMHLTSDRGTPQDPAPHPTVSQEISARLTA